MNNDQTTPKRVLLIAIQATNVHKQERADYSYDI